ncbi:MmcQ/YjbR family DNA-binding protein [Ignavibacteria bacterium]|nr:MmcQ/YjbR family DNA-binding protein [Bacteroidota bacterium]MCZ2133738.1 MmcQ/YjbR family DNA-binding protein [Bacteroidota bacterium]
MTFNEFREYCLAKCGATEDFPFDETTLVFRVGGKMFALIDIETFPLTVNLKCNPEYAVELRERYPSIRPGWHQNKRHWNTIADDGSLPDVLIPSLINHSYDLVFSSLTAAKRTEILADK